MNAAVALLLAIFLAALLALTAGAHAATALAVAIAALCAICAHAFLRLGQLQERSAGEAFDRERLRS